MKNKKTIKMGAVEYEVQERDFTERDYHNGMVSYGYIYHKPGVIEVSQDLCDSQKKITLIHELIHGIFQQYSYDELDNDEKLIEVLAISFRQLLSDDTFLSMLDLQKKDK